MVNVDGVVKWCGKICVVVSGIGIGGGVTAAARHRRCEERSDVATWWEMVQFCRARMTDLIATAANAASQ